MSQITKIVRTAPRIKHRSLELFKDSRYKPRVVRDRTVYRRKGRQTNTAD